MLLTTVKVKNYLSINGESELPMDPRVTVLLGANDHGKSNLLRGLEHLNFDRPILGDDENWDSKGARIDFAFRLTDAEINKLRLLHTDLTKRLSVLEAREADTADVDAESDDESDEDLDPAGSPPTRFTVAKAIATSKSVSATAVVDEDDEEEEPNELSHEEIESEIDYLVEILRTSPQIVLSRDGVGSPLSLNGRSVQDTEGEIQLALADMIPRVELFKAFSGELQDSVTADEIASDDSEFLQGIFFYAGLDPLDCSELFVHDDETDKRLEEASKELDAALRQRWAQGVDLNLHFQLKHRGSSIELLVEDPAVRKRKARMSKRSSGVTQFFRLSMMLHARRKKNPANSYIYVFDEPGVFLHPKGQKDLLSVFEQLAQDTQIVYATHSLFMLNQNFPERHRLITKSGLSTVVDAKPYRANWKYAVDALGVRLTANILFSPNILLTEGDSDPIYIYEILRLLNYLRQIDGDANLLGIMSYSDLPNLRFLMQTFRSESDDRLLVVLFEGDSQGKAYLREVSNLSKRLDVKHLNLENNLAIEDYCLHPELFVKAAIQTLEGSFDAMEKKIPRDLSDVVKTSWNEFTQNTLKKRTSKEKKAVEPIIETADEGAAKQAAEQIPTNAGAWFKALSMKLLDNGSSKVALARNYAFLSRESGELLPPDSKRLQLAKSLGNELVQALKLPSQLAKKQIES